MPQRPGRPRTNFEERILQEMSASEKQAEEIIAKKINSNTPSIMAFEAACLLLEIEAGAAPAAIQRRPIFQKINQFAKKNGLHGEWRTRDFLQQFLKTHAPVWDYREDARQGEIEDRNYERENERITKEIAEDKRLSLARTTKLHTPDAPDAVLLCGLAWEVRHKKPSTKKFKQFGWSAHKHRQVIRKTWPTLRELKMATAISERALQKIIKNLRPKKTETTKEPRILPRTFDASRRRFSWRGACRCATHRVWLLACSTNSLIGCRNFRWMITSENSYEKQHYS